MILLLPFFYVGALILEGLLVGTVIVLWVGFYLVVFCAALLFAAIRAIFRSNWPRDPKRPSLPRQAMFSDRR